MTHPSTRCTLRCLVLLRAAAFPLLLLGTVAPSVVAAPIVVGIMEGYSFRQGQENTIGMNGLNTDLRNRMVGQNYYSRVFEWGQVDEARNFFNLFESSTNYLLGYSRGGYQALRVANAMLADNKTITRLVQLDPVRCGGTVTYGADSASDCVTIFPPSIQSSGPQVVPTNVGSATNYYQTGGGITGERNVTGAANVNVNTLLGDSAINHSTIDDNVHLRRIILDDVFSRKDNNRLMTGLGGPAGFGTLAMTRNDDGSTSVIDLPFQINLNGSKYSSMYVNNNGNVSFGNAFGAYTPTGFSGLPVQMIAPMWSDVDTRCGNCGEVYLSVPTSDTAVVTWNNVGFFSSNASKTNTFQLIIRDRNDLIGSNTDVEFRYDTLQWTTGDASGGTGGLGGAAAFAGYTGGGTGVPQTLIGSGTADVLTLNQRSNIGIDGRWNFAFREGTTPGTDINNPLLPDVRTDGWHFQFTTTDTSQLVWSDPEVVFGYDYRITSGANFQSFVLPVMGDNIYQLWLGTAASPVYVADILGGSLYSFSDLGFNDGVDYFGIRGVETALAIDPNDVTAFVTGLGFSSAGTVQWTQSPLSIDVSPVPEPHATALMLAGLVTVVAAGRRRLRAQAQGDT